LSPAEKPDAQSLSHPFPNIEGSRSFPDYARLDKDFDSQTHQTVPSSSLPFAPYRRSAKREDPGMRVP
jgi:hypothetical protein